VAVDAQPFDPVQDIQWLLKSGEVAEWLDRPVETVERLAEDGMIPARKLKGEWRFGIASQNLWAEGRSLADLVRESLAALVQEEASRAVTRTPSGIEFEFDSLPSMEVLEQAYIAFVLQRLGGNKTKAAEVLGLDPSTLYRKIKRYGL
jgi:DNA-binding NtrC family response regulator